MRFLKMLFWILLGALIAAFFFYNGDQRVSVRLWGNLVADFVLPVLMVAVFLIGFVPMFLLHHATRWRLKQRLASSERALNDLRAVHAPAPTQVLVADPAPVMPPPPPPAPVDGSLPLDLGPGVRP